MRDFDRIRRNMRLIEEIWRIDPDYRFIQLIEMIKARYSQANNDLGRRQYYYHENEQELPYYIIDLFHLEDEDLECYLYELLAEMKSKQSEVDLFFDKLLVLMPNLKSKYEEHLTYYDERLDTVMVEDVFMPEIIMKLKNNEDEKFLRTLFDYLEECLTLKGEDLSDIIFVTILESLGNEKVILDMAQKYMGPVTTEMQEEADRGLGRLR